MEKVSVITVVRNNREQLKATMESVAALSYGNVEYVVVDGASTDGTAELLAQAALTMPIKWISEPDKGIYDAMNKGVALSTGRRVIFMNAGDCFAAPDVIERSLGYSGAADADVIYGDVVKGGCVKVAPDRPVDGHRMFFCHQSAIALRQRLVETPFDINHKLSADFKWVKMMLKQGRRFCHVPLAISVFDTGGVSNTSRSRGLADNIRVVMETDPLWRRAALLPRLAVPYVMCRLRGK